MSKTKRNSAPPASSPATTIMEQETVRQAEVVAAGYEVLSALAQRHHSPESGSLRIAGGEIQLLVAAGILPPNESGNLFAIRRLISHERANRQMREMIGSATAIEGARGEVAKAKESVCETTAVLEDLEVNEKTTPKLAQQIRKLQTRLDDLQREQRNAERNLATMETARDRLRERLPKPLKTALDVAQQRMAAAGEFREMGEIESRIRQIEQIIDPKNSGGLRAADRPWEHTGHLDNHFRLEVPNAITYGRKTKNYDREVIAEHADALEAKLPKLRKQLLELQAEREAKLQPINELRDEWVYTGKLTAAALVRANRL